MPRKETRIAPLLRRYKKAGRLSAAASCSFDVKVVSPGPKRPLCLHNLGGIPHESEKVLHRSAYRLRSNPQHNRLLVLRSGEQGLFSRDLKCAVNTELRREESDFATVTPITGGNRLSLLGCNQKLGSDSHLLATLDHLRDIFWKGCSGVWREGKARPSLSLPVL